MVCARETTSEPRGGMGAQRPPCHSCALWHVHVGVFHRFQKGAFEDALRRRQRQRGTGVYARARQTLRSHSRAQRARRGGELTCMSLAQSVELSTLRRSRSPCVSASSACRTRTCSTRRSMSSSFGFNCNEHRPRCPFSLQHFSSRPQRTRTCGSTLRRSTTNCSELSGGWPPGWLPSVERTIGLKNL